MAAAESQGRAFAATWQNESGEVVGTTWGGTMCLWPRKAWRIRIARDGFEHVIRCGECPGCLELDRRRLAERLFTKYGANQAKAPRERVGETAAEARRSDQSNRRLYLVRVWIPLSKQAELARKLHRRRGLDLLPGWARLGARSFALVSREKGSLARVLKTAGVEFRVETLLLSRGRRAWRALTAGLLVAREIYGEQLNRYYFRGLPKLDRERWEVQKLGAYKSYDRARSPRAWTGRRVVLVPPGVWRLSRTDRRSLRGLLLKQTDPEGVRRIMGLVADTLGRVGREIPVSARPKAVLTREQVVQWYRQRSEASKARTTVTESDSVLPPLSEAGGYRSSEHDQGELMPRELERERRLKWEQERAERYKRESQAIIERMRKKSEERR